MAAVGEYGKGRSMAILTDSTWMWSLPLAGTGGRPDAHRKFFANAMRWLIQDPELSRVRVQLTQKEIGPGELAIVEIQSLNEAYRLSGGADVTLKISPLDEASSLSSLSPEKGQTGEDGKWVFKTKFDRAGAYRVEVQGEKEGHFIGRDDAILIVQGARKESLYSEPQPELLNAISEASTGTALNMQLNSDLQYVDQKQYRIVQQKSMPIWNRYTALVFILFGIAIEWWWRRRRGFA